jgi:hypothetical protein
MTETECLLRGTDWVFKCAIAWVRSQERPPEIYGGQSGILAGFSSSTSISPDSVIPSVLYAHVHVALTRRTSGRSPGTFQEAMPYRKWRELCRKVLALGHFL